MVSQEIELWAQETSGKKIEAGRPTPAPGALF